MTTFMQDIPVGNYEFPIYYTHSTAHMEFHPVPKDNRYDERIMYYDFHLFHTMPYSWFSQACSIHVVQLFSQTIYMYVTCSFGIFDTNGLQLDFTSTKRSVGIVDTRAYSWCTESWEGGSEALPLAGMFGGW